MTRLRGLDEEPVESEEFEIIEDPGLPVVAFASGIGFVNQMLKMNKF